MALKVEDKHKAKMQSDSVDRKDLEEALPRGGRRMIRPKMDVSKALSIMGFTSARALDQSGGNDAVKELNIALSLKMEHMEKKKRIAIEKGKKLPETQKNPAADKVRDEIRTLHEAYQFLSKKYIKHMNQMRNRQGSNNSFCFEDEWNIEEDDDYEPPVYENEDEIFIGALPPDQINNPRTRKKSKKK